MIDKLRRVDQTIDTFRDLDGELSEEEKVIFFNISCSEMYSPLLEGYLSRQDVDEDGCEVFKDEYGSLSELLADLAYFSQDFYNEFTESDIDN
eukprot:CAMPEP_0114591690 /NCGR_PEP_ID=MMETSP0125-20121206/13676_1 /TAXON_ID=485358 ORGANISM="Aristerostoma sp., Strain ATCC 50986" /NCGR_SAMPLE_ID=MMETSP0125 /ASSEMBLY_ACC=CAM_ASM_000245 /LENGTH=92 /DNA_ID=CAMNT_0001789905 /DNA_START=2800 /DNA_END=3078 /DNA_ORIENTATION=+